MLCLVPVMVCQPFRLFTGLFGYLKKTGKKDTDIIGIIKKIGSLLFCVGKSVFW